MKYLNKKAEKLAGTVALNNLANFVSKSQLNILYDLIHKSEESSYFVEKVVDLDHLISNMPKTYEQDGKGEQAVAYLHYFRGGMDWYITEKDMESEQYQAFGLANLGYGAELGYISIIELMANDIEIDLHFEPTTIGSLK